MRIGSNALQVIQALESEIATLRLPDGVRLIPTYDRSELILGSVNTLKNTLIQQAVVVTVICLVFLFHARSALIVMIVLPLIRRPQSPHVGRSSRTVDAPSLSQPDQQRNRWARNCVVAAQKRIVNLNQTVMEWLVRGSPRPDDSQGDIAPCP